MIHMPAIISDARLDNPMKLKTKSEVEGTASRDITTDGPTTTYVSIAHMSHGFAVFLREPLLFFGCE